MDSHALLVDIRPYDHHADWAHRGTAAFGPAADRPETGNIAGEVYIATNTRVVSVWDGASWTDVPTRPTIPQYAVTGDTDRSFDASATTVDELANVLATLISDLIAAGWLGKSQTVAPGVAAVEIVIPAPTIVL